MSDVDKREPFAATKTCRGGRADGTCKLVGCGEPGGWGGNLFYCSELHGQLANPEQFTTEEYAAIEQRAAAQRDFAASRTSWKCCPTCGGSGAVRR